MMMIKFQTGSGKGQKGHATTMYKFVLHSFIVNFFSIVLFYDDDDDSDDDYRSVVGQCN